MHIRERYNSLFQCQIRSELEALLSQQTRCIAEAHDRLVGMAKDADVYIKRMKSLLSNAADVDTIRDG